LPELAHASRAGVGPEEDDGGDEALAA
jgi:hypothetical protein